MYDIEHMFFTGQSTDAISHCRWFDWTMSGWAAVRKRGKWTRWCSCARAPVLHENLRALALDILVIQGWSEFYHRI